jgi:outer membrane protein OmpA-like peptidoglycan-associated protein
MNDRLSGLRADLLKDRLEGQERVLRGRLVSTGKGSREMIVGTGRDDSSDALDRRVEFKVAKCSI